MNPAMTAAGGINTPKLPKFLVLDAGVLDDKQEIKSAREFIKLDRIEFLFPEGLAQVPLVEECRALCDIENFDIMYDLTMQYLTGKRIVINIYNDDSSKTELGTMVVTDKNADLRLMQCIADYPILVNWLTEFMGVMLSKKFPLPSQSSGSVAAGKKQKKKQADRQRG